MNAPSHTDRDSLEDTAALMNSALVAELGLSDVMV